MHYVYEEFNKTMCKKLGIFSTNVVKVKHA
jgi:hypothetical protein